MTTEYKLRKRPNVHLAKSVTAYVQDNFNNDARDYLVLPLVAQQLKTAIGGLHTETRKNGWVRALRVVDIKFLRSPAQMRRHKHVSDTSELARRCLPSTSVCM